jgi:hypothetical protein
LKPRPLVAFLSRVDFLRGVERFARANPHLLPHLGLRKPPGHTILTLLLHRLDPEKLQEALLQVFPGADLGEVLVVDGKHLKGSGKGKSPQVRLVSGEGGAKRGAYLFVLKGNQGELLEWALEVFKGMEERRLPGETEAVWNLVRDGEVWTYRVWASPYLPEEIRVFPGCGQVVRMEREVVRKGTGEVRCTVSYALTSLGPEVADARRLRAFLVSLLHRQGVREKKAALEAFSFNPLAALRFLGLYAV